MWKIFKHEKELLDHSFATTVFEVLFILAIGGCCLIYNINGSLANFEYVLSMVSIIFILIIPILTMNSISEERRQRTDQLLYSLPLSMWQIVAGKFLALMEVFLVPFLITCIYPLIFSRYGEVNLAQSYGALFAFLLFAASWVAVGMFISSLTESQGIAAGLSACVILVNYFLIKLSELVTGSRIITLVTLTVFNALIMLIIKWFTKSIKLGAIVGGVLEVIALVFFFIKSTFFETLVPTVMRKISLYNSFESFTNGIFDIKCIVLFLSVIGVFLFLTVQSMEKRRYN